jgi:hypothetical protein
MHSRHRQTPGGQLDRSYSKLKIVKMYSAQRGGGFRFIQRRTPSQVLKFISCTAGMKMGRGGTDPPLFFAGPLNLPHAPPSAATAGLLHRGL